MLKIWKNAFMEVTHENSFTKTSLHMKIVDLIDYF